MSTFWEDMECKIKNNKPKWKEEFRELALRRAKLMKSNQANGEEPISH